MLLLIVTSRSPAPDSWEGARLKASELPRQTKPPAGIPEKKKQTKRRRKRASEKSWTRRGHPYDDAFRTLLKNCSPLITHESRFPEYNTNDEKLRELKTEYRDVINRLRSLKKNNQLTEYQYHMLIDMTRNVLEYIAAKYDRVRKGVGEFMGGRIIKTEASRILNEGIKQEKIATAARLQ